MGGSSSSTRTTNITSGTSHLDPFMGKEGKRFMQNIMRGSAAEENRIDTYFQNQGYPSTTYYTEGLLQPLATSMLNMEGMGKGAPYLEDYSNSLDQAYSLLGQIPGYVDEGADLMRQAPQYLNSAAENLGTSTDVLGEMRGNLSGIAAGDQLDESDPRLQNLLSTIQNKVRNDVGGQFAGAGRSFSGAHANALGEGEAAGMAQPLFTDFWNRQNQMMQANQMLGGVAGGYGDTASGYGNIAGAYGGLGTSMGNLGGMLGNVAGAYGDLGSNYGALGNAYDAMQQNAYNVGTQGVGLLSDMFTIPYQKWSNLAGVQLPISSTFGNNKWYESQRGTSNSSTSSGFSDRRLKDDIAQVGSLFDGTPVYRYSRNGEYQIGLMADEVTPEAVSVGIYGYKMVDYKKATARAAGD